METVGWYRAAVDHDVELVDFSYSIKPEEVVKRVEEAPVQLSRDTAVNSDNDIEPLLRCILQKKKTGPPFNVVTTAKVMQHLYENSISET